MTDQWKIDRLDLPAYLSRIGDTADLAPDAATLARLHRAHVAAIPFENLDVALGRGVRVDLDGVQDKLVRRRRGGYCYEHAVLFAAVLARLGFTVDRYLARIGDDPHRPRPRTHMTLRARSGSDAWLADVGFGAGLLEPIPWDTSGAERRQGGWAYRLLHHSDRWQLRERIGGEDVVLYSFTEEVQHASDITMANHFTSTHESSPFVGGPVVMRKDDHLRRSLVGRRLTLTRPGEDNDERELTDAEFAEVLQADFGLYLAPADVDAMVGLLS